MESMDAPDTPAGHAYESRQKEVDGVTRRDVLKIMTFSALPASSFFGAQAKAQNFPSRPVRLLLSQPPGGAADRLMRVIAQQLEARWKQSVVVESRPGGGIVVCMLAVIHSPPDGYTIGLTSSALSINAAVRDDIPYDGLNDLEPLVRLGYYPLGLVAAASFPADDIAGLVKLAKSKPDGLSFGSNGPYSAAHVAGAMLNEAAGISMQHVPYNGATKMYNDIVGGRIPIGFSVVSSAEPFIKTGQMKVLGLTSAERSPLYPSWPTIAETIPGYEAISWAGFGVAAGTPKPITDKLIADLQQVLGTAEIRKSMDVMGFQLSIQSGAQFDAFIRAESKRYKALASSDRCRT